MGRKAAGALLCVGSMHARCMAKMGARCTRSVVARDFKGCELIVFLYTLHRV